MNNRLLLYKLHSKDEESNYPHSRLLRFADTEDEHAQLVRRASELPNPSGKLVRAPLEERALV